MDEKIHYEKPRDQRLWGESFQTKKCLTKIRPTKIDPKRMLLCTVILAVIVIGVCAKCLAYLKAYLLQPEPVTLDLERM